jgi:hypothetical protein
MNTQHITKCMDQAGWKRDVNYGGQIEYHRSDYEFRLTIVNADYWELERMNEDRTEDIVSGETRDELNIALDVIEAMAHERKPEPRRVDPRVNCTRSGVERFAVIQDRLMLRRDAVCCGSPAMPSYLPEVA